MPWRGRLVAILCRLQQFGTAFERYYFGDDDRGRREAVGHVVA